MSVYQRTEASDLTVVDRFGDGVGWLAHPEEEGKRVSHALVGDDGLWLLDPLDAPGVDGRLSEFGDVAGVAVCSSWHARDADAFARRHDVPVFVPAWMGRVEERVNAPVERYQHELGDSGFRVLRHEPLPGWQEAMVVQDVHDDGDRTLYVPDSLGSVAGYALADERVGVELSQRLAPPRDVLSGVTPDRLLFGHGPGVFDDADDALTRALATARRRLPRALVEHGWLQLRALVGLFG